MTQKYGYRGSEATLDIHVWAYSVIGEKARNREQVRYPVILACGKVSWGPP